MIVTALVVLTNIIIHLSHGTPTHGTISAGIPGITIFGFDLGCISDNCLHPELVVNAVGLGHGQLSIQFNRLLLSVFIHRNMIHLIVNMCCLWHKGMLLENLLGHQIFLRSVCFSLLLSNSLYAILSVVLNIDVLVCITGFSLILVALQVVSYHCHRAHSLTVTLPWAGVCNIPYQYLVIAETAILYAANPQMSMLGHSCGVLSGIAFVNIFATPAGNTHDRIAGIGVGDEVICEAHRRHRTKGDLIRSDERILEGALQPCGSSTSISSMLSVDSKDSRFEADIARDFDDGSLVDLAPFHGSRAVNAAPVPHRAAPLQAVTLPLPGEQEHVRVRRQRADKLSKFAHENFAHNVTCK